MRRFFLLYFALASVPVLLTVAAILLLAPIARAVDKDPVHAVTDQIICPCSCGEVLTGCICETGISMKSSVEKSVKAGKSKDEIMNALVAQYGEVVRGAPKPEGFNLIVWVAPFLATLAGFVIAFFVLRRWVRRRAALVAAGKAPGTVPFPSGRPADEEIDSLRARAEEELRQLRSSR